MLPNNDGRLVTEEGTDTGVLRTKTRELGDCAATDALRVADGNRLFWSDPDGTQIAAIGSAATITATGADRFQSVRATAEDLFRTQDRSDMDRQVRPRLFGGFAFHPDPTMEGCWTGFPAARFVLPRLQLTVTDQQATLTANAYGPHVTSADVTEMLTDASRRFERLASTEPGTRPAVKTTSRGATPESWRRQVRTALDRIKSGHLRKVVLAQSLEVTLDRPVDPIDTVARLTDAYPDCYRFLIQPEANGAFVGATPERLIGKRGRTVETEALAGSIGRGETPVEDEALATELTDSRKDQHEHAVVVEAIRDQLTPYTASISVGDQRIRKLATVQHLETPIRGLLDGDRHVLSLVEALHPTPAVGGLPPSPAQESIREIESFNRGWYAAPIGWFDDRGNGEFTVGLRSGVLDGTRGTLFAGAGIVDDSDPDQEWDEIQLKYRPMLDTLAPAE
ncbi:MAG: isochorismate synthase [Halobacteriales archaeon]|nr:isochorismate synthase [Halobacteriales archaeon]